jgi:hypothetical protein
VYRQSNLPVAKLRTGLKFVSTTGSVAFQTTEKGSCIMRKKPTYLPVILKSSGWVLSRIGTLLATIFAASAFATLLPILGRNSQLLLEPLMLSALIAAIIAVSGFLMVKWTEHKFGDPLKDFPATL